MTTEIYIRPLTARGAELNDYRTMSRGQEGGLRSAERSSCSSEELLESDWRERSEHAESMKKELREAQIRLEGDQRCVRVVGAQKHVSRLRVALDLVALRELNFNCLMYFQEKSRKIPGICGERGEGGGTRYRAWP